MSKQNKKALTTTRTANIDGDIARKDACIKEWKDAARMEASIVVSRDATIKQLKDEINALHGTISELKMSSAPEAA